MCRLARLSLAIVFVMVTSCSSPGPAAKPIAAAGGWSRFALGRPLPEDAGLVESIIRIKAGMHDLWLAVGAASAQPGALQKPAAWASGDDLNWSPIGVPVGPEESGSVVSGASDGERGLLVGAVGAGRSASPAVWHSKDGWAWEGPVRLPVPTAARGATVRAVTKGPGGWVAVGGESAGGAAPPLVWHSSDGETWMLSEPGPLPESHSAWSVASSGDRFVAVVSANRIENPADQPDALALASSDGRTWERQPLNGFDHPVVLRSVLRVRDWFVIPVDCCSGSEHRLAVSRDGLAWVPGLTLAGLTDTFAVTRLADREGRLVRWAGHGPDLWVAETSKTQALDDTGPGADAWKPIELPAAPDGYGTAPQGYGTGRLATAGPTVVVDQPSRTAQRLSYSILEGTWTPAVADIAPPSRQSSELVQGLAGQEDTVVAVGVARYIPLSSGEPARRSQGRVWVASAELSSWEEALVSSNITELVAVASDGKKFVAVGAKGDGPVVLLSRDGRSWTEGSPDLDIDRALAAPGSVPATSSSSGTSRESSGEPPGDQPGTTIADADQRLFGGELPASIVRFGSRFVVRTKTGGLWSSVGGAWSAAELPQRPAGSDGGRALCASDRSVLAPPYRSSDGLVWEVDPGFGQPRPGGDLVVAQCAFDARGAALLVDDRDQSGGSTPLAVKSDGRLDPRPFTGGEIDGVGHESGRWLVFGSTDDDPAGDPAVWWSSDADGWATLDAPTDLVAESGHGALDTALVWNGRLLLAGGHNDAGLVLAGPSD